MKKSKLSLGLMTGLLSCVALAGCTSKPLTYTPDDSILTYTLADGSKKEYSSTELWGNYYKDSSVNQTMFDAIYKLIVQNYFLSVDPANAEFGSPQMKDIEFRAEKAVRGDEEDAKKESDNGDISYDDAFEAKCEAKGCEDRAELFDYYKYQYQEEQFKENFYDVYGEEIATAEEGKYLNILRDGVEKDTKYPVAYDGYIKNQVPYHVSHILVKLDDSSNKNFWNGTISEQNCETLYNVTKALAARENNFGVTAKLFKDYGDTSSANNYGELGIVDKDVMSGYVKEFMSIYVYENMFGTKKAEAAESNIGISTAVQESYKAQTGEFIGEINYSAFKEIYDVRKVTKGYKDVFEVNDNDSVYYPRNIYYNDYLNKHELSLIKWDGDGQAPAGFHQFENLGESYYLSALDADGEETPILVVRAGGESYQGIHFIVVNRTPFEDSENATIAQYYTTKYPTQAAYPQKAGEDVQTYVNYLANTINTADLRSKLADRASTVQDKIEQFDSSYLNMFIYQTYLLKGNLKFNVANLESKINEWIEVQKTKSDIDDKNAWNEQWDEYIDILTQQQEQRTQLLPHACAVGYQYNPDGEPWTSTIGEKVRASLTAQEISFTYENKEVSIDGMTYKTVNELYEKFGGLCNNGKIK